jgi:hypothetical protein
MNKETQQKINKRKILQGLSDENLTRRELEAKTGVHSNSVNYAVYELIKEGAIVVNILRKCSVGKSTRNSEELCINYSNSTESSNQLTLNLFAA